ncbi:VOC family protein [Paenibacillus sp. OSY-SE]|uniref:VOC family protein n=1 Tax=Paenibacillus sp. OSY-SE TaxID=1196323 RepID=UPI000305E54E|nr:VOC family protein [Paenibacillus sp. OSY-SE]
MLTIEGIHHVSLNVRDLRRSKDFYERILGLQELPRPAFDFEGAWYAIGTTDQQLHLIVYKGETLRTGEVDTKDGHFALRVSSYENTQKWLDQCGITYTAKPYGKAGFPQIFILDPDQNIIELNAERLEEN